MNKCKIGEKYGRLTVIRTFDNEDKVICRCDCGNIKTARGTNVYYNLTKSCGCLFKEGNNLKHGGKGTRLYGIWKSMRERCNTKTCTIYKNYGGRGISICKEWDDFAVFRDWALNNGYSDELSIDRIDVNGNYNPENCRWATNKEQANNKRTSRLLTYNGETKTITEWAEKTGIKVGTIWARLHRGWSAERTLSEDVW